MHPADLPRERSAKIPSSLSLSRQKLRDRGLVGDRTCTTYVTASLAIPAPTERAWTRHELDAAIRLVGKRLRRELGRMSDDVP